MRSSNVNKVPKKVETVKPIVLLLLVVIGLAVFTLAFSPVRKRLYGTSPDSKIQILFSGDVMLDRDVEAQIEEHGGDAGYLLEPLAEKGFFENKDIVSANLEGPVNTSGTHSPPKKKFDFAFRVDYLEDLKKYNFNFFTIANNHVLDQGFESLSKTRKHLKELGYSHVGGPDGYVGDCSSTSLEVKGYEIGMIGISRVSEDLEEKILDEKISQLAKSTDIVIVNVHWGEEYEHRFCEDQQELAHDIIRSGADVVIGHHPHVIQGMELYENRPIFYSLGNFIFDQYWSENTQKMLSIELEFDGTSANFELNPLTSNKSRLKLAKENQRRKILNHFAKWSESDKKIREQIISGSFSLEW